jgi:hypothetical protein
MLYRHGGYAHGLLRAAQDYTATAQIHPLSAQFKMADDQVQSGNRIW